MKTRCLLVVALVVALTGCTARKPLEWERVEAAADCRCADGSPFSFWERRADPTRVVFFLNGGGVCWDATACAFTGEHGESDFYDWGSGAAEPENRHGLFDVTRRANPFADYSFVYVSPCTGDAHLGNVSQPYSPALTVRHNGLVNGTAALEHLAAHYPNAKQVVVIGKTAGSVAAPLYGGLVADRLPRAKVVVLGAQSGAWPDDPGFNAEVLGTRWGAHAAAPRWAVDGLTAAQWGVPRFWSQAARHNPRLVLARFDFAFDPHAASEVTRRVHGDPTKLLAVIDGNEAAIEAAGARLHSYTAPGNRHGLFEFDRFYTIKVKGVKLVDWLHTLVTDAPPKDVHCAPCGPTG